MALVGKNAEAQSLGLSRARLQALINAGQVTLGTGTKTRAITDSNHKVLLGEAYQIIIPPPEAASPQAQAIALQILYEDADVVVINKPAGMVVHPAAGNRDGTLVNALLAHCGASLSGIGGVARPGIVHRLDKDTSGLMVVAKHDAAHQALAAQFADRSLSRIYHAIVWGLPLPAVGEVDAPIGRHPKDRKKMAVVSRGGKAAVTAYKTLKNFGIQAALVECRLATGRTHQIRVHLAHLRHPVVGDPLYGGRVARAGGQTCPAAAGFNRQALHAISLKFNHPITHKVMQFKAEMPADMLNLIAELERSGR